MEGARRPDSTNGPAHPWRGRVGVRPAALCHLNLLKEAVETVCIGVSCDERSVSVKRQQQARGTPAQRAD